MGAQSYIAIDDFDFKPGSCGIVPPEATPHVSTTEAPTAAPTTTPLPSKYFQEIHSLQNYNLTSNFLCQQKAAICSTIFTVNNVWSILLQQERFLTKRFALLCTFSPVLFELHPEIFMNNPIFL